MRTFGTLGWDNTGYGDQYRLIVEPHVAIKVKRIFGRVSQGRTGTITMMDTPEIAADLVWFLSRYPLIMSEETNARLHAQAARHEKHLADVNDILSGRKLLDEFPPPARPNRDYQQQAADLAYLTGGLLLGDEVGLGKTQSAITMLRDPSTVPALIVVPTHLPHQWLRELNTVLPHLRGHIITRATPVTRRADGTERTYDTGDADVLIISYSKLAGWRDHLAGNIRSVIFDEVQELRRDGTAKYEAAAAIARKADRRCALSATPIYNYGGEAFNIYEILKPGVLGSRSEFFREWGGSMRPNGDVVVSDPAALGAFLREQGLLLRRTRHEVGRELPAPIEVVVEVDSSTESTDAVMDEMVRLATTVLHGPDRTERFVASGQMDMRLRQATGVDKAPSVAAFVRILLESEQKVVLFGWHREVWDIWQKALAEFNPVLYTGTESPTAKDANARRFIEDPTCRIFMCSLRSGAGLDGLQGVTGACVFGELDWSPAVHHQAIGRVARDGQENEVVAYYLISRVGSDPVIGGVLETKRQQAEPFMAGDGALFTAQPDTSDRIKTLARAVLAKAQEQGQRSNPAA